MADDWQDELSRITHRTSDEEDLGKCFSRPSSVQRSMCGIHYKLRKGDVRSFQYVHIGFERFDGAGTRFVVEYNTPDRWRVTVTGRNLWKGYNYHHHHRLEWIEEADRDFAKDGEMIVTKIEIVQIDPETGEVMER